MAELSLGAGGRAHDGGTVKLLPAPPRNDTFFDEEFWLLLDEGAAPVSAAPATAAPVTPTSATAPMPMVLASPQNGRFREGSAGAPSHDTLGATV